MYAEDRELTSILHQAIPHLCRLAKEAKLSQRFLNAVVALRKKGLTSSIMRFLPGVISIFVSAPPALTTNHNNNNNNSSSSSNVESAALAQNSKKKCANIVEYACAFGLTPFKAQILDAFGKSMDLHFAFKNKLFFELSSALLRSTKWQTKKFLRLHLLPLYEDHVLRCESRRAIGIDNALRYFICHFPMNYENYFKILKL
jgi:hypothetical protein